MSVRIQDIIPLVPTTMSEAQRRVIASALLSTLTTVKFSNNLTPPKALNFSNSDDEELVYINDASKTLSHWATFIRQRTWAASAKHAAFSHLYLATTWHKADKLSRWQAAAKIVDKQHSIVFKCKKLTKRYAKLDEQSPNNEKAFLRSLFAARLERAGNCGVLAHFLLYSLWGLAIKTQLESICRIEVVKFKSIDHTIVLLNRDPKSDINDHAAWACTVIDPWRGLTGQALIFSSDEFELYVQALCEYRYDIVNNNFDEDDEELIELVFAIENPSEQIASYRIVEQFLSDTTLNAVADESSVIAEMRQAHKTQLIELHQGLTYKKLN